MLDDSLIDQNQKVRDALVSVFERYGVRFMRFTTVKFSPPERLMTERKVLVIMTNHMSNEHAVFDSGRLFNPTHPFGFSSFVLTALKPFNLDEIRNAMHALGREDGFLNAHMNGRRSDVVELWISGGGNPVDDTELKKLRENLGTN